MKKFIVWQICSVGFALLAFFSTKSSFLVQEEPVLVPAIMFVIAIACIAIKAPILAAVGCIGSVAMAILAAAVFTRLTGTFWEMTIEETAVRLVLIAAALGAVSSVAYARQCQVVGKVKLASLLALQFGLIAGPIIYDIWQ